MKVSITVICVGKYNSITGQALLYGVPDTDLLCGAPQPNRHIYVMFRGPSALPYPPLYGERIRFEYETVIDGDIKIASKVISREAPGDLSDTGPEGIVAATGHNPPSEYTVTYIRNMMGTEFCLFGRVLFNSCGDRVADHIASFVENHGKDSVLFLEGVASDFLSLVEPMEAEELSACGLSVRRSKMYQINSLSFDRPFFNCISDKEVSLAAVYAGIYKKICLKRRGAFADAVRECLSQMPEFTQRTAVKLIVNAAVLSGLRYSDRFFLSLDICRENSSRLVRSLGPRASERLIADPYMISELGFASPISVAMLLESEDVRFGKPEDFIRASAGALLTREYANGTEAVPEDEFRNMLLREVNSSGIFKTDSSAVSDVLSGKECERLFAVRESSGGKYYLSADHALREKYLAKKLAEINASGIEIPEEKLIFPAVDRIVTEEPDESKKFHSFGKYLLDGYASMFGDHGVGDYAVSQTEAIGKILSSSGTDILTGEPGSGKTTIVRAVSILAAFAGMRVNILSPTGKAVKRTEELLNAASVTEDILKRISLMTVHKYVYSMSGRKPSKDPAFFIIDECSMLDTDIFAKLMFLVSPGSKLILSGDTDQLMGTGSGSPFREIIDSGMFRHIALQGSYRQTNPSIRQLAEKIRVSEKSCPIREMFGTSGGDIYDLRDHISP